MINFVLGRPPKSEADLISQAKDAALASIEVLFTQNIAKATNQMNSFKASTK
jgi:PTH1 family peptidyl-tRNA hydrolase